MHKLLISYISFLLLLFPGQRITDFKLKDINNRMTLFSEVKGEKLTVIDFWATWCKPCIQAIPKLNQISEQFMESGVKVVGINVDSPRNAAKVKPFASTYNINYPVLRDPNSEVATDLNVTVFPTLYIVNNENEIVFSHQGFRPGDEKIIKMALQRLLKDDE